MDKAGRLRKVVAKNVSLRHALSSSQSKIDPLAKARQFHHTLYESYYSLSLSWPVVAATNTKLILCSIQPTKRPKRHLTQKTPFTRRGNSGHSSLCFPSSSPAPWLPKSENLILSYRLSTYTARWSDFRQRLTLTKSTLLLKHLLHPISPDCTLAGFDSYLLGTVRSFLSRYLEVLCTSATL